MKLIPSVGVVVVAFSVSAFFACTAGDGSTGGDANNNGTQNSGANGEGGVGFGGFGQGASSGGSEDCAETTAMAQEGNAPADIIIAVDTSGSMDLEAQWTQDNMNAMVQAILGSGIDAHVVMISSTDICVPAPLGSGACPADEQLPNYRHVQVGVSSNDAFDKILQTYPDWSPSLRAGASKTILVVTDDDADMGHQQFMSQLIALDATFMGFKYDAIGATAEPFVPGPCFLISAHTSQEHIDLVVATGGVFGDLCLQNFGPVFNDISTAVVASSQIPCVYDIPPAPNGDEIDFNKVNVEYTPSGGTPQQILYVPSPADCGPNGGWYYDNPAAPTQILLCDATCAGVQADNGEMAVKFGCATKLQ